MRPIKFRAWDENLKVMQLWETLSFVFTEALSLPHVQIMQATGMKDNHGKEIYFDDIVRFEFKDKKEDEEYDGTGKVVETVNGGAGLLYEWDEHKQEVVATSEGGQIEDFWEDGDLWSIEVIGNIHQNPELLKK